VALLRALVEEQPDTFRLELAMSLSNRSNRLASMGRMAEALDDSAEAVSILRTLAQERPVFRIHLVRALCNRSIAALALWRLDVAWLASAEAVELFPPLVEEQPETASPDLAVALGVHGAVLYELGEVQKARHTIVEAIDMLWPYFEQAPTSFESLMRTLLAHYSRFLGDTPASAVMRARFQLFGHRQSEGAGGLVGHDRE